MIKDFRELPNAQKKKIFTIWIGEKKIGHEPDFWESKDSFGNECWTLGERGICDEKGPYTITVTEMEISIKWGKPLTEIYKITNEWIDKCRETLLVL